MSNKTYPDWYIRAVKNKDFYTSNEYRILLQDGINEYNKAIENKDQAAIEKWKDYVLRWLEKKETNKYMLTQHVG